MPVSGASRRGTERGHSDVTRVAVVSGGGTGIGRAIARRLMDDGLHVVITGRRDDVLAATAAELAATGGSGSVEAIANDASDPVAVQALVDDVAAEHGTVDAVVCNAGGAVRRRPRRSWRWPRCGGPRSTRTRSPRCS